MNKKVSQHCHQVSCIRRTNRAEQTKKKMMLRDTKNISENFISKTFFNFTKTAKMLFFLSPSIASNKLKLSICDVGFFYSVFNFV